MKVLNIPNAMWLLGKPTEIEPLLQKVEKDPAHCLKIGELDDVRYNLAGLASNPNMPEIRQLILPMLNRKQSIPAAVIDIHGQTYVLVREEGQS